MQIRTALDKLERTWEISKKTTNRFTLITVLKYCDYNDYDLEDNQQITNKQPTDNQQITTNKNDKNKKEWKEIYEQHILDFIEFRKKSKKPMTDKAIELFIKKLHKLSDNKNDQIKIVEKSIISGWTDIYELKYDQIDDSKLITEYSLAKSKANEVNTKEHIRKEFINKYGEKKMKQVLEKINWPSFISNF